MKIFSKSKYRNFCKNKRKFCKTFFFYFVYLCYILTGRCRVTIIWRVCTHWRLHFIFGHQATNRISSSEFLNRSSSRLANHWRLITWTFLKMWNIWESLGWNIGLIFSFLFKFIGNLGQNFFCRLILSLVKRVKMLAKYL